MLLDILKKYYVEIIFILFIIIILYIFRDDIYKFMTSKSLQKLYDETNGYLDEAALNIIEKINKKSERAKKYDDYLYTALIYDRNIIQNEGFANENNIRTAANNYNNIVNDTINFAIFDLALDFTDQWEYFIEPEILNNINNQHNNAINTKKKLASFKSKNKKETVDKFIDLNIEHTNDAQNVHDSNINNNIKQILSNVLKTNMTFNSVDEVIEFYKNNEKYKNRPDFKDFVEYSEQFKKPQLVKMFDMDTQQVYELIWDRINDNLNYENRDNLIDAFYLNILDTHENGHMVCANGKIGRVVSTLNLLDYDQENISLFKTEDIRNLMFEETRKIIDEIAKNNLDTHLKDAAKEYTNDIVDNTDIKNLDEQTEELNNIMKTEISKKIDELGIKHNVKLSNVQKIKEEALAAI